MTHKIPPATQTAAVAAGARRRIEDEWIKSTTMAINTAAIEGHASITQSMNVSDEAIEARCDKLRAAGYRVSKMRPYAVFGPWGSTETRVTISWGDGCRAPFAAL